MRVVAQFLADFAVRYFELSVRFQRGELVPSLGVCRHVGPSRNGYAKLQPFLQKPDGGLELVGEVLNTATLLDAFRALQTERSKTDPGELEVINRPRVFLNGGEV